MGDEREKGFVRRHPYLVALVFWIALGTLVIGLLPKEILKPSENRLSEEEYLYFIDKYGLERSGTVEVGIKIKGKMITDFSESWGYRTSEESKSHLYYVYLLKKTSWFLNYAWIFTFLLAVVLTIKHRKIMGDYKMLGFLISGLVFPFSLIPLFLLISFLRFHDENLMILYMFFLLPLIVAAIFYLTRLKKFNEIRKVKG
ncbi:MAG: hypothetical protein ACE5KE_00765 [Methanosarcinales archaeon]